MFRSCDISYKPGTTTDESGDIMVIIFTFRYWNESLTSYIYSYCCLYVTIHWNSTPSLPHLLLSHSPLHNLGIDQILGIYSNGHTLLRSFISQDDMF